MPAKATYGPVRLVHLADITVSLKHNVQDYDESHAVAFNIPFQS